MLFTVPTSQDVYLRLDHKPVHNHSLVVPMDLGSEQTFNSFLIEGTNHFLSSPEARWRTVAISNNSKKANITQPASPHLHPTHTQPSQFLLLLKGLQFLVHSSKWYHRELTGVLVNI